MTRVKGEMRRVCVEVPHHVTALFRPIPGPTPRLSGSIGAGIALDTRFKACTGPAPHGVGEGAPPQLRSVMERLGAADLEVWSIPPLPPGRGYAVSAAAAVAGALLSSATRGGPLTASLRVAHEVEVEMRTGLGDVTAITCGIGAVFRITPGPPEEASVECIPMEGYLVVTGHGEARHTSELLREVPRLLDLASSRLSRVLSSLDIEVLLDEAQSFTVDAGLDVALTGGRRLGEALPKGSYRAFYVKKSVAVVVTWEDEAPRVAGTLESLGLEARVHLPSRGPPRIASAAGP